MQDKGFRCPLGLDQAGDVGCAPTYVLSVLNREGWDVDGLAGWLDKDSGLRVVVSWSCEVSSVDGCARLLAVPVESDRKACTDVK